METWKKVLIRTVIVIIVMVLGAGIYLTVGLSGAQNLEIGDVDFTNLADGTYVGSHRAGRWTNEVAVTVSSGRVVDVDIVRDVRIPRREYTAALIDKVIAEQSLQVDAISGATVTCKAYLKAMENALK